MEGIRWTAKTAHIIPENSADCLQDLFVHSRGKTLRPRGNRQPPRPTGTRLYPGEGCTNNGILRTLSVIFIIIRIIKILNAKVNEKGRVNV